jgi:hypothetical protein
MKEIANPTIKSIVDESIRKMFYYLSATTEKNTPMIMTELEELFSEDYIDLDYIEEVVLNQDKEYGITIRFDIKEYEKLETILYRDFAADIIDVNIVSHNNTIIVTASGFENDPSKALVRAGYAVE